MNNNFSLEGKRVVITGCASGIGRGIALGVAGAGADIVAIDIADLSETAEQVRALGKSCACYQVDLSNREAVEIIWQQMLADVGTFDVLFNNAGIQHRDAITDFPEEQYDAIMSINLKAAFVLSQKAATHFLARKISGKIINTASLYSIFGGYHVAAYTSAKHAILGLTKALSNELAPYGICVNALIPGYIITNVTKALWSDVEKKADIDKRIPLGRWGTPDDLAGTAVFLASPAADYVTGIAIPVDGGYTAR